MKTVISILFSFFSILAIGQSVEWIPVDAQVLGIGYSNPYLNSWTQDDERLVLVRGAGAATISKDWVSATNVKDLNEVQSKVSTDWTVHQISCLAASQFLIAGASLGAYSAWEYPHDQSSLYFYTFLGAYPFRFRNKGATAKEPDHTDIGYVEIAKSEEEKVLCEFDFALKGYPRFAKPYYLFPENRDKLCIAYHETFKEGVQFHFKTFNTELELLSDKKVDLGFKADKKLKYTIASLHLSNDKVCIYGELLDKNEKKNVAKYIRPFMAIYDIQSEKLIKTAILDGATFNTDKKNLQKARKYSSVLKGDTWYICNWFKTESSVGAHFRKIDITTGKVTDHKANFSKEVYAKWQSKSQNFHLGNLGMRFYVKSDGGLILIGELDRSYLQAGVDGASSKYQVLSDDIGILNIDPSGQLQYSQLITKGQRMGDGMSVHSYISALSPSDDLYIWFTNQHKQDLSLKQYKISNTGELTETILAKDLDKKYWLYSNANNAFITKTKEGNTLYIETRLGGKAKKPENGLLKVELPNE